MDVGNPVGGVVEADALAHLREQALARSRRSDQTVGEGIGERVEPGLGHAHAPRDVARDVRRVHEEARLRAELAAVLVVQAVAAADHGPGVDRVCEADARLHVAPVGLVQRARHAALPREEETALEVGAGGALRRARRTAYPRRQRARLVEGEAAHHPVEALGDPRLVVPAEAEVQRELGRDPHVVLREEGLVVPLKRPRVARAHVRVRGITQQEAGHRAAARVVGGVGIAPGEGAREVEEAVAVPARGRVGADVPVVAAQLQGVAGESMRVAGLGAGGVVDGPEPLAAHADPGVLVEVDAGQGASGEVPEAERAAVELVDVGLELRLREAGEGHARVEQGAGPHGADPVQDAPVVHARLGPLSLVGEGALQAVVAAELVSMVPVEGEEGLAGAAEVMVEAHQLRVVVVAGLVHGVGEVVQTLARHVG